MADTSSLRIRISSTHGDTVIHTEIFGAKREEPMRALAQEVIYFPYPVNNPEYEKFYNGLRKVCLEPTKFVPDFALKDSENDEGWVPINYSVRFTNDTRGTGMVAVHGSKEEFSLKKGTERKVPDRGTKAT